MPSASDVDARRDAVVEAAAEWRDPEYGPRAAAVERTLTSENAFTEEALAFAVNQQMSLLTGEKLRSWIQGRRAAVPTRVGVLSAGNIPMVGLQDFLAVILTGHDYVGAVSSRSPALLPGFAEDVSNRRASVRSTFVDAEALFISAEAVIATGSDDTEQWVHERCDEHGVPEDRRLVRGHRFAVAVLDGGESMDDYERLAEDTLLHEGYGCRNVAIIWAPQRLPPDDFLAAMARFRGVFPAHPSTPRRLKMQQAFLEAVNTSHAYGEGLEFLVSKGEPEPQQPGHVRWSEYTDSAVVADWLSKRADRVQLVVMRQQVADRFQLVIPIEPLGNAQRPSLAWCPDQIDTVDFLVRIGCDP